MAMNKAEKAMLEQALTAAALRWTAPVERDVAPPDDPETYVHGWDCNVYAMTITQAWTGRVSHGFGNRVVGDNQRVIGRQGSRRLFSTREKAIAAMRYEAEQMAAAQLRGIDVLLESQKR